jgi:hypothetical protein
LQANTNFCNYFLCCFQKEKQKQKLKRITIAKSKPKENLRKVNNLLLLSRQLRQKIFFLAATLFFKMSLVGTPSAK